MIALSVLDRKKTAMAGYGKNKQTESLATKCDIFFKLSFFP